MRNLNIKTSHKAIETYYQQIGSSALTDTSSDSAVAIAFAKLLRHCTHQFNWKLVHGYHIKAGTTLIRVDGALMDDFNFLRGIWIVADAHAGKELGGASEIEIACAVSNILLQTSDRIIVRRGSTDVFNGDISVSENLVAALKAFFEYQSYEQAQWQESVEKFQYIVPQVALGLKERIEKKRRKNKRFIQVFDEFSHLCRETINPNISLEAIEEMLIQHILVEPLFSRIFESPDFFNRNIIAQEIEKVIRVLALPNLKRRTFTEPLERFYEAIVALIATLDDPAQKYAFLHAACADFFQGFAVKKTRAPGAIPTPEPIVTFMVRSAEQILQKEFGRSLADKGVHILDPFVGTGSFIVRIMKEMPVMQLAHKYACELHGNDVMLIPYYIASISVERAYLELTDMSQPFEGLCLVDTLDLVRVKQLSFFSTQNAERVKRQQNMPLSVIIGTPPFDAAWVHESDNKRKRKYPETNQRVSLTYGKDSSASLLKKLSDPYVKAIRWASDRLGDEGIIVMVTQNSFVSEIPFDGMRKHLEHDFDSIYILDLGGNVRKTPKPFPETYNVLGLKAGICISILVKKKSSRAKRKPRIYYASVDEQWRNEQKYEFLTNRVAIDSVHSERIYPDKRHNWLTRGMRREFETFIPMGTKEAKRSKETDARAIFKIYSLGVFTNRDSMVYDFDGQVLKNRVEQFCNDYNAVTLRCRLNRRAMESGTFFEHENLKWSSSLKSHSRGGRLVLFDGKRIRTSLYRPFTRMLLYYDSVLNDRSALFERIFPDSRAEVENSVICVSKSAEKPFTCLMASEIPNLVVCGGFGSATQCFPFYVYDENDGTRRENITDWSLDRFRAEYGPRDDASQPEITKWDIYCYVYAILHHPKYRAKYAVDLQRDLPRIPFAPDFWSFAKSGAKLAELHINYEDVDQYELQWMENTSLPREWNVKKMRLSPDSERLIYNDSLTLAGIPPEVFEYRLGHRSALEWIVDQYQVRTDTRSGFICDPNRPDDPQYIVHLIGRVITVSLETVKLLRSLPPLA